MKNETSDRWIKCISTQGNIRGIAIEATQLVIEQGKRHKLKGESIRRLGEALMGALLISSHCKRGERINLNVQGTGRLKQVLVDAYPDATVRGYLIENPNVDTIDRELGPWGEGTLSVLKTKDAEGEKAYIGTVPLLTGHMAKDLSFYWVQSEQIPSAVGLAVAMEGERVLSAGGFLIQALPGASPEEVRAIEKHILEIESLTLGLANNKTPVEILSHIFQNTAFMMVEERPIRFQCHCSWERVVRAISLIGLEELQSMLAEELPSVVTCDFCTTEYVIEKSVLKELIEGLSQSEGDPSVE